MVGHLLIVTRLTRRKHWLDWFEHGREIPEATAYCAELGAEPYICLNIGTGSLREAAALSGRPKAPVASRPERPSALARRVGSRDQGKV